MSIERRLEPLKTSRVERGLAIFQDGIMRQVSHFFMGLGGLMLVAYCIIGIRTGADFVHPPFMMLWASIFLLLAGVAGRFVLPKM